MSITDREPIPELPEPAECKRLRVLFGVSQSELAREIGITRQMINRYESGRSKSHGKNRIAYARVIDAWAMNELQVIAAINSPGDSFEIGE